MKILTKILMKILKDFKDPSKIFTRVSTVKSFLRESRHLINRWKGRGGGDRGGGILPGEALKGDQSALFVI